MDVLPFETVVSANGLSLPVISRARATAARKRADIARALEARALVPVNTCLMVNGSLARGEWTTGSDIDWALLVDGPADQQHARIAAELGQALEPFGKAPNATGVFAGLAFSHQLVHLIGGDQDSNRNTTQRILLLLESTSIPEHHVVRDRVVRAVIERYLQDDQAYFVHPRIKLRLSRKLIFVAGLVACLLCKLRPSDRLAAANTSADLAEAMADHLFAILDQTPLDLLSRGLLAFGAGEDVIASMLGSYEAFLAILDDPARREHLDTLTVEAASADKLYAEARALGHQFQKALEEFLLHTDEDLARHTIRFGVF